MKLATMISLRFILPRDAMVAWYMLWLCIHPSIRLSVTSRLR